MNIATSTDRRRTFDRVVISDPRIVDRRQEWRDRIAAKESLELRQRYFEQSANYAGDAYARAEMLDAREPDIF